MKHNYYFIIIATLLISLQSCLQEEQHESSHPFFEIERSYNNKLIVGIDEAFLQLSSNDCFIVYKASEITPTDAKTFFSDQSPVGCIQENGSYFYVFSNLKPSTTYYYAQYVEDKIGYIYSSIKSFTTLPEFSGNFVEFEVKDVSQTSATMIVSLGMSINEYNSIYHGLKSLTFSYMIDSDVRVEFSPNYYFGKDQKQMAVSINNLYAGESVIWAVGWEFDDNALLMPEPSFEKSQGTFSAATYNRPSAVDLGLSVLWANCNIGAEQDTDVGEYVPMPSSKNNYLKGLDIFGTNNDPVWRALGCRNEWRLPSKEEFEELMEKCTVNQIEKNGIEGYEFVGTNGNKIFIPITWNATVAGQYYWTGTNATKGNDYEGNMYYYLKCNHRFEDSDELNFSYTTSISQPTSDSQRKAYRIRPVIDK